MARRVRLSSECAEMEGDAGKPEKASAKSTEPQGLASVKTGRLS
jgi:hypothetical protein